MVAKKVIGKKKKGKFGQGDGPAKAKKVDCEKAASSKKNAGALKSSFRHRKTSTAYHSAKLSAQKLGLSPDTCKKQARDAAKKMSMDIEAGLVKEEDD